MKYFRFPSLGLKIKRSVELRHSTLQVSKNGRKIRERRDLTLGSLCQICFGCYVKLKKNTIIFTQAYLHRSQQIFLEFYRETKEILSNKSFRFPFVYIISTACGWTRLHNRYQTGQDEWGTSVYKRIFKLTKILFLNQIKSASRCIQPYNREGRGNPGLRDFTRNYGVIACWVAELNAALCLDTRVKKNIKYFIS